MAPPPRPAESGDTAPDLEKLKRYFADSMFLSQTARTRSLQCVDYYDTDQYTLAELARLAERHQQPIVINRIKPAINGIVGIIEKGRSDPRCWPRNPGDEDTADAATDILRYIADFNRFKRVKQDCFRDMLVAGTGAALVGVDADLQVTITQVRWEEIFLDPRARRLDGKDARYVGVAKWMYADDAAAMWPKSADAINATASNTITGGMAPDQTYEDRPSWYQPGAWIDLKSRRLLVCEMYYNEGGWKRACFTGADVLEAGPSPYRDHKGRPDCPIEVQSAYIKRDNSRYGAVWDMIGPQDEINKRRSSALHRLIAKQVEIADPMAAATDVDVARKEAAKPDGVLPLGYRFADNRADMAGHLEMLQEAKGEIERMGLTPSMIGRLDGEHSGRALLARQQSGLAEFANLYGGLEDFELRIYRQCWARARQYWKAPQWIRVTDDEDAPRFVGLNMPVTHPATGAVLGYRNPVGEMDVDIEVDAQPDTGTIQAEAFTELMQLVGSSPIYQQQIPLTMLIQLSPIPHKRSVLDTIKQNEARQQQAAAQQHQIGVAAAGARIDETVAKAGLHKATAFSKTLDSITYAHETHADHTARGLEAGLAAGREALGAQQDQDQFYSSQQAASADEAWADQGTFPSPSGEVESAERSG